MKLWYDKPAAQWTEALPLGNGRLGAMLFGGVGTEQLQLNEESVWSGAPHCYDSPDALAALPEIRRAVFADAWKEAHELADKAFMGRPVVQSAYQTAGDLHLDFGDKGEYTEYRRTLDLSTAICTTTYTQNGTHFVREAFVSYPDDLLVLRLTADMPGSISFVASFSTPQRAQTTSTADGWLYLDGVSGDGGGEAGSVRFRAAAHIEYTGNMAVLSADADGRLSVSKADSVIVRLNIATSYVNYHDVTADPVARVAERLDAAIRKPYAALKEAHLADYCPLIDRVTLQLGTDDPHAHLPTDQRLINFSQTDDSALVALHFQYGRYLLIASSRPGNTQPANLQGIWNDSLTPPWGSKFTININTEMNYWHAAPANLLECYAPLFSLITDISETGTQTAKTHYGAKGWVAHHNVDGWRGTAPVDGASWGTWPTGGAWLCKSIRDAYDYTGDLTILETHYALLYGAAQFFLETLVEYPTHGCLVTCPSVSPENSHHRNVTLCAGPTMDTQIVHDLFDTLLLAATTLKRDAVLCDTIRATKARLAPMRIGAQGQLQEWMEDWDASATEQKHRHISHLYGLYPSDQITPERTLEFFDAARKSLEKRGDGATGWSLAWKINLWARLQDGEHAYAILKGLLTPERTAPNLFDLHPPFQIDGNFGATSGICEMLLQSHGGQLNLLPAVPPLWKNGSVTGLLARGGYTVDVAWQNGILESATIRANRDTDCTVRYGDKIANVALKSGETVQWDGELRRI